MAEQDLLTGILLAQHYITEEDVAAARAYASSKRGTVTDYLLREGLISKSTLGLAIAESLGVSFADLDARAPGNEVLARIPENLAKEHRIVFIHEKSGEVLVATDKVSGNKAPGALQSLFPGKAVRLAYAFPESIDAVLSRYEKELNTRFSEIIEGQKRIAPELFEEIIKDAILYRASDIHFEPSGQSTAIRFRIDGMLRLAGSIGKELYESVINRIKIEANLRTDEHFAPQDGAIRFKSHDVTVDLRVSIVPLLDGEKVVIRILAEYVKGLSFADLGFTEAHIATFEQAAKKPFGMILVSGPTGSGKTTTLYALIKKLNTPELNVTTIEDPVEYRMAGANQIQVNPKTDLTFAKGLRSIVRQDPNIILVGEIRDRDTAETAVNAALTGHLLLSTFHANDASTSIPRLLDMEIEPFLLASTLELLVAQRLVRKICEACRESYEEKPGNLQKLFPQAKEHFSGTKATLYRGKGCAACNGTGYKGRTSVIEMITVTSAIKEKIALRPTAADIWELARRDGNRSMFEDGIDKAKIGVTTIEEVLRVASPPAESVHAPTLVREKKIRSTAKSSDADPSLPS